MKGKEQEIIPQIMTEFNNKQMKQNFQENEHILYQMRSLRDCKSRLKK